LLTAAAVCHERRLLRETFEPELLTAGSRFAAPGANEAVVEVSPPPLLLKTLCTNPPRLALMYNQCLIVDFELRL
jgi:hypothetical protein